MRIVLLILLLTSMSACVTTLGQRDQLAERLASAAHMQPFDTQGVLPLHGFIRIRHPGAPLWVFIEGDGMAWVTPTLPSRNPTPVNPVALRLATIDPADNVLYLARPGQYTSANVDDKYWLGARFSPEVLASLLQVTRAYLAKASTHELYLVGYSGGGALAALMAETLVDDSSYQLLGLITVAGNLDTAAWVKALQISPLVGSLNPADRASSLANLPQQHLLGSADKSVPRTVFESYLEQLGDQRCVQIITFPLPHNGPWDSTWTKIRRHPPSCH